MPLPRTYGEGRLMIEAKGWPIDKAAEYLSEQPELERFHTSHAVISRKTSKGGNIPLEPEIASAIERMETQPCYERRAAIVEAGLRALHGEPPVVDVRKLANDLREHLASSELAQKLADALLAMASPVLEEMACGIADRLRATSLVQEIGDRVDRLSVKRVAITAAVAALVACVALVVAPALAARPASSLVVVIPGAALDGSAVRFDPGSLLAMSTMGEKPLDQPIPVKTLPGQRVAPCDEGLGQEAIYGNCWAAQARVKPPCGRLFRRGEECYAPVAAEPTPNRPSAP